MAERKTSKALLKSRDSGIDIKSKISTESTRSIELRALKVRMRVEHMRAFCLISDLIAFSLSWTTCLTLAVRLTTLANSSR